MLDVANIDPEELYDATLDGVNRKFFDRGARRPHRPDEEEAYTNFNMVSVAVGILPALVGASALTAPSTVLMIWFWTTSAHA